MDIPSPGGVIPSGLVMAFSPHNAELFAKHIERQVATKRMTYMEAVIDFCTSRGLEPDAIVPFINDKIKTKLDQEGQALHLLQKHASLPI